MNTKRRGRPRKNKDLSLVLKSIFQLLYVLDPSEDVLERLRALAPNGPEVLAALTCRSIFEAYEWKIFLDTGTYQSKGDE
jgi:hypothetical protein